MTQQTELEWPEPRNTDYDRNLRCACPYCAGSAEFREHLAMTYGPGLPRECWIDAPATVATMPDDRGWGAQLAQLFIVTRHLEADVKQRLWQNITGDLSRPGVHELMYAAAGFVDVAAQLLQVARAAWLDGYKDEQGAELEAALVGQGFKALIATLEGAQSQCHERDLAARVRTRVIEEDEQPRVCRLCFRDEREEGAGWIAFTDSVCAPCLLVLRRRAFVRGDHGRVASMDHRFKEDEGYEAKPPGTN